MRIIKYGIRLMLLGLVFSCPASSSGDTSDALLRRYEKQIHQQERQLTRLRSRLTDKEREVDRWQSKAESAKSAWSHASLLVDQTRSRIKSIRVRRQRTQFLANAAGWKTTENVLISRSATEQAKALAQTLYVDELINPSRKTPLMEDAAPEFVLGEITHLTESSNRMAAESQKEEIALRAEESAMQREEEARTEESDRLRQQQDTQWSKWQEALRRKTSLEDEISQIDQSAKALQVMLQELRDHRDQAQALRVNRTRNTEAVASLRGTLPWPAQGKVVQNFGRQYSEGLNQLVVSNGIKIQSDAHHVVRVIAEGKILFANAFRQYGQLVIVQHKNGLTSVYGGLGETTVKEGQLVAALDQIGQTADLGSFYFELRHDEQPINPLVYLSPAPSSELSSRRTFR